MIVIYSKDVDDFVNNVIDYLDTDFIRIGESDIVRIESMDFSNDTNSYIIETAYLENVELENIKSVWFNGGCINSGGDDYEKKCHEILNDAFIIQKKIKKIGKRIADFETNRLDIMLEAKKQGLKIPHTLITGNKKKLQNFYNTYIGKNGIVSKRILDSFYYNDDSFVYNFNLTFSVTPDILSKIPEDFTVSLFQQRIIADFEIRVIYIDGFFYCAAIHAFEYTDDIRTMFRKTDKSRIIPFKLPANVQEKLEKVFKKI